MIPVVIAVAVITTLPCALAGEATIRPSETITLRISGVPAEDGADISQQYHVGDDGKFPLPHIGRIVAAGLTPSELGLRVEQLYRKAEIFSQPTVVVLTPEIIEDGTVNAHKWVTVTGEVMKPQRAAFTDGMTLLDALASAGGLTDWASKRQVRVMRGGKTTEHDLTQITKDPTLDITLRSNDRIIVPHR